jgi:NAD(P)-dependent dehydrogenase (short-subunit alcohol dehydrogenase family)
VTTPSAPTKAAMVHTRRSGGFILDRSSVAGPRRRAGASAYRATKLALTGLTQPLPAGGRLASARARKRAQCRRIATMVEE